MRRTGSRVYCKASPNFSYLSSKVNESYSRSDDVASAMLLLEEGGGGGVFPKEKLSRCTGK